MIIELDLPMPPSTNALWRSNRGRVHLSSQYKKWIAKADALVTGQPGWRGKTITGRFTVMLVLDEARMRSNRDWDNTIKAPQDFAKRLGLIVDDSIKYSRGGTVVLAGKEEAPEGARLILTSI